MSLRMNNKETLRNLLYFILIFGTAVNIARRGFPLKDFIVNLD